MDIVFINQLSVETTIGVYDWEKTIRQTLKLDIKIGCDIRSAAAGDDIAQTIDYAEVSTRLLKHISSNTFELVETVAQQVADIIINEFNALWVSVTLFKPGAVPEADSVGVQIERFADSADK